MAQNSIADWEYKECNKNNVEYGGNILVKTDWDIKLFVVFH